MIFSELLHVGVTRHGLEAVSKDLHLYQRDGTFYVRRRVAADLRQAFGREFFVKTLDMTKLSEARTAVDRVNGDFQMRLAELRLAQTQVVDNVPVPRRRLDNCNAAEIEMMVGTWFRALHRSRAFSFSDDSPFRDAPDESSEGSDIELQAPYRV